MNQIWSGMMLVGIVYGVLNGRVSEVSEAIVSSGREAVTLCVAMCGAMAFWSGLMEIAKDAGLLGSLSRGIRPVMRFLFPTIPDSHPALEHITTNCVANILGLGSASTVYGLKAMEALEELKYQASAETSEATEVLEKSETSKVSKTSKKSKASDTSKTSRKLCTSSPFSDGSASDEMCDFLILNISSLQLIPVTIIAYRGQYGSVNPTAIVGPGIVATAVSTGAAIAFCKIRRCMRGCGANKSDNAARQRTQ